MQATIEQRLAKTKDIPILPAVAMKVLEQCQRPDPDVREVVKTLTADAALSAKILRMANSPMLGLRREVTTVSHAVAMLGLNALRALALSFSIPRSINAAGAPWFSVYWKRSALCALTARHLAALCGFRDLEEAFLAGLMQDIGILALAMLDERHRALIETSGTNHAEVTAWEREIFGTDHTEAGVWLARHWKLPQQFAVVIGQSHGVDLTSTHTASDAVARLARIVAVSNYAADIWLHPDRVRTTQQARDTAQRLLSLPEDKFETLMVQVHDMMGEMFALLDAPMDSREVLDGMLEDAREALLMSALTDQVRISQTLVTLEDRAVRAEEKSLTDALTGLANRARFEAFLDKELSKIGYSEQSLSLIVLDIDHFKNDTHGHLAGDAVLKGVGALLGKSLRPRDLPARCSGEEFMIVLPDTPAQGAVIVAERMRQKLAELQIQIQNGTWLQVTASFGCATVVPPAQASRGDLIQAADNAMYAAKRAGRNRVITAAALGGAAAPTTAPQSGQSGTESDPDAAEL